METEIQAEQVNTLLMNNLEILFYSYDVKQKNHLNELELRTFLNDLRKAIGLNDLDDNIFDSLKKLINRDKFMPSYVIDSQNNPVEQLQNTNTEKNEQDFDKANFDIQEKNSMEDLNKKLNIKKNISEYTFNDILTNIGEVLLQVVVISRETKKKIRALFCEFDISDKGHLTVDELKFMCHLECDRLGVVRSDEWQVEFLMSMIDDDGNGSIDLKEFYTHYREINLNQLQNRVIKNKANEIFKHSYHLSWASEVKLEFIKLFSKELKKIEESDRKNQKSGAELECENIYDTEEPVTQNQDKDKLEKKTSEVKNLTLDNVNEFSKKNAKKRMSISSLVNYELTSSLGSPKNSKHLGSKKGSNHEKGEKIKSHKSEHYIKKNSVSNKNSFSQHLEKLEQNSKHANTLNDVDVTSEDESPLVTKKIEGGSVRSQFYSQNQRNSLSNREIKRCDNTLKSKTGQNFIIKSPKNIFDDNVVEFKDKNDVSNSKNKIRVLTKKKSLFNNQNEKSKSNKSNKEYLDKILNNPDDFLDQLSKYSSKILQNTKYFDEKIECFKALIDSDNENSEIFKSSIEKFNFERIEVISKEAILAKNTLQLSMLKQSKILNTITKKLPSKFVSTVLDLANQNAPSQKNKKDFESLYSFQTNQLNKSPTKISEHYHSHKFEDELLEKQNNALKIEMAYIDKQMLKTSLIERLKGPQKVQTNFPAIHSESMVRTPDKRERRSLLVTGGPRVFDWNSHKKKENSMSNQIASPGLIERPNSLKPTKTNASVFKIGPTKFKDREQLCAEQNKNENNMLDDFIISK